MISKWNDQVGRRNRKPIAVLVTEFGTGAFDCIKL